MFPTEPDTEIFRLFKIDAHMRVVVTKQKLRVTAVDHAFTALSVSDNERKEPKRAIFVITHQCRERK